jgi:hypothetical protein
VDWTQWLIRIHWKQRRTEGFQTPTPHHEIPNFWQSWAEFPVPWKIHPYQPNKNTAFTHLQIERNPWLGGYRPQIRILSALCPQLNLLNPPEQNSWVHHWLEKCTGKTSYLGTCLDNIAVKYCASFCSVMRLYTLQAPVS